jgi:hypothetical protein
MEPEGLLYPTYCWLQGIAASYGNKPLNVTFSCAAVDVNVSSVDPGGRAV